MLFQNVGKELLLLAANSPEGHSYQGVSYSEKIQLIVMVPGKSNICKSQRKCRRILLTSDSMALF
jgi:hypothetical protein